MIFPFKKQPLYAPMLSSFGGGSVRGFGRGIGGGGSDPYPFSITANATTYTSYAYFRSANGGQVGSYSGYQYPNLGPTITGNASSYVEFAGASQRSDMYYGRMQIDASECLTLGVQTMEFRGTRGGNVNAQYVNNSPNLVSGGQGSRLTVEVDFAELHANHANGGILYVYFLLGCGGTDFAQNGSGATFPAASGGGATGMAVVNGSTWTPVVIAGGGGGAYHTDSDSPYQRPGLNAFCPSLANISTYQSFNHYGQSVNYISSTSRPWIQQATSTGSTSGASWDQNAITYSNANSYGGAIPSLKDHFIQCHGPHSTRVYNIDNPTNGDAHSNAVIYGTFGGGGAGAYGGGGGAGYFGGFAGEYQGGNSTYGRAQGGQSYYNPTYCSFVSHGSSSNRLGKITISA